MEEKIMAWKWEQAKGRLLDPNNNFVCLGYSGFEQGKNNPQMQNVRDVGPLPCGVWQIGELVPYGHQLGPNVLPLSPQPGTDTFGRDGFFIHGDSIEHPGDGSHGCIVLPPWARMDIARSMDKLLVVV